MRHSVSLLLLRAARVRIPSATGLLLVGASGVGTDTMSQFLAEAVSEAMTKEALKHNITGTVHIAQATETGVVSSGYSKDGAVLWSESGKRKLVAGAPQGVKASD